MSGPILNSVGQIVTLIGVVLLFRYGMPYRVRADGGDIVTTEPSAARLREELNYDRLGWLGLVLILVGTAASVVANFWSNY
jgi:hypothetical protein